MSIQQSIRSRLQESSAMAVKDVEVDPQFMVMSTSQQSLVLGLLTKTSLGIRRIMKHPNGFLVATNQPTDLFFVPAGAVKYLAAQSKFGGFQPADAGDETVVGILIEK